MTSMIDTMADSMEQSFSTGKTLQKTIRDYINATESTHMEKDMADDIAKAVSEFRRRTEEKYYLGPDDRKSMNNVINDVSRIAKDAIGYKIVCTSRKNGIYEAKDAGPVKSKPAPTIVLPSISDDEAAQLERILTNNGPSLITDFLVDRLGEEAAGLALVESIKCRRLAAKTSDVESF